MTMSDLGDAAASRPLTAYEPHAARWSADGGPRQVVGPCPAFGDCGGCTLQDLAYPEQLARKRARLVRALAALDAPPTVPPLVPLDEPWRYRGKAELSFRARDGRLLLGFHAAGSFARVVDLPDCLLLPEAVNRVILTVRALAAASGLPAHEPRAHRGVLRHLIVRHSRATGRIVAVFVTAPVSRAPLAAMAEALRRAHADVDGVGWGVTDAVADAALPERVEPLSGTMDVEERIGPFRVRVPPLGFLQSSVEQAERIYADVAEGARGARTAWDLYCGLGLVSLYLSRSVERVLAVDVAGEQVARAREHAAAHGLRNVECHQGLVEDVLGERRFWMGTRPDVVVVDPPRAGLQARAFAGILAARPHRVAYVSCNPEALARDLAAFAHGYPSYRVSGVTGYDMFPQTGHLETLAWLERA